MHIPRWAYATAAGCIFALTASCGDGGGDAAATHGDCARTFAWQDQQYVPLPQDGRAPELSSELGPGRVRRCPDQEPVNVTVYDLRGIDPAVAVAVRTEPPPAPVELWGGPGYIVESRQHPLHSAVFADEPAPVADAGYRCGKSRRIRARAVTTPRYGHVPLRVKASNPNVMQFLEKRNVRGDVTFDARSRIIDAARNSTPFVRAGERLALDLRACHGMRESGPSYRGGRRLIVDRLIGL